MILKFRIDYISSRHTRFTVFQDHGNCGQLCMEKGPAALLMEVLSNGHMMDLDADFIFEVEEFDNAS